MFEAASLLTYMYMYASMAMTFSSASVASAVTPVYLLSWSVVFVAVAG